MASILDRYGIKEVADVTFYDLSSSGTPTKPVLYLDTLKVSTIEQTAETSDAKGGKGNATLISWDYGKEITVTLEDALFSAKSMAIMFGNGTTKEVAASDESDINTKRVIMKTEQFVAKVTNGTTATIELNGNLTADDQYGWKGKYEAPNGAKYVKHNPKFYDATGAQTTTIRDEQTYFCTYDIEITNATVIEISANSFPGTYYVTGDTFARAEKSGKDEFFQFIIPKAKVTSENTITLEAEGDPSVFNMNLKVLRPTDGVMMKLVKYDLDSGIESDESNSIELIHNHDLKEDLAPGLGNVITLNNTSGADGKKTNIIDYIVTDDTHGSSWTYVYDDDYINAPSYTAALNDSPAELNVIVKDNITENVKTTLTIYYKTKIISECTLSIPAYA